MLGSVVCVSIGSGLGVESYEPEVSPQINNLPCSKSNKHSHGAKGKPLDSVVCALIGVPELLLSGPEVIHLGDNLGDQLFNTSQLCLNRLQLLSCLNSGPILGICSNIDIELDVTTRVTDCFGYTITLVLETHAIYDLKLTSNKKILKAHIKCRVSVRCESHSLLASNVLRLAIFISYSIPDLKDISNFACQLLNFHHQFQLTCMFTTIPSPLDPLIVAVTTTKVSLETKFRMHRSDFLS